MNIALNLPSVQQSPRLSQKRQELLKAYSPQRQIKPIIPQNQQQKQVNQQVQIQREARSDPLKAIQLSTGFGTHKILEMEAGIVSNGGKPLIMQMKEHSFSKVPQILQKPNYQPQNTADIPKTQNTPKKPLENKFVDSLSVSPLKKSKRPAYKSIPAANIELPQLFPQNFEEENEYQNEENEFDEEQNVQSQFNPITGELNQQNNQKVEFDHFNTKTVEQQNTMEEKQNEFENEFEEENKKQNQQKESEDYLNVKQTEKKEVKNAQKYENEFDEFDEEHNGFDEPKQKYEPENENKKNGKQNNDEFDNSNNDAENEPKNDDFD
ncbi:Hypothetical_protein [Hexamita inflata]|uniref:Hypothetical_protein n=1 Tax=Hexamita inflata TaxID=28002 RepID=A0AA86UQX6_9EUKA|nr:Hypothetical protein HINF_LOCUS48736 [Hexamita inflata]